MLIWPNQRDLGTIKIRDRNVLRLDNSQRHAKSVRFADRLSDFIAIRVLGNYQRKALTK
jgi:hypothetical protein